MTSIREEVLKVGDSTEEFTNIDMTGGLSVNGIPVIDSNRNAYFENLTSNVHTALEVLEVQSNTIMINDNLSSGAPPSNLESGITVRRGDLPAYKFLFRESDQSFVIGETGQMQAVATRQDEPVTAGVPYWNSAANRFDTGLNATLNDSGILTVAGVVVSGGITTTDWANTFTKPLLVNYVSDHGIILNTSAANSEVSIKFQRNDNELAVIGVSPNIGVFIYDNLNGAFPLYAKANQTATSNRIASGVDYSDTMETSAQLQANSTTRGFLPPRMTTAQRVAIASPAAGLVVFDTTLQIPMYFNGSSWNSFGNQMLMQVTPVTASGTTFQVMSNIPSWVNKIQLTVNDLSTTTATPLLRLGTLAGGIITSGYKSSTGRITANANTTTCNYVTDGIRLFNNADDTTMISGSIDLINMSGNTWVISGNMIRTDSASVIVCGGVITLANPLHSIHLTSVGGTSTFDNGSVSALLEGYIS